MFRRLFQRACLSTLSAVICCAAEPPSPPPPPSAPVPTAPAPKPIKIGGITVTGSFRTREEDWNWFKGDTGDNSYLYSGNLFRIAFSQSKEFFDWQLEFAAPFMLALPNNAIAAGTQGQLGLGASYFAANNHSQYSAMVFGK